MSNLKSKQHSFFCLLTIWQCGILSGRCSGHSQMRIASYMWFAILRITCFSTANEASAFYHATTIFSTITESASVTVVIICGKPAASPNITALLRLTIFTISIGKFCFTTAFNHKNFGLPCCIRILVVLEKENEIFA